MQKQLIVSQISASMVMLSAGTVYLFSLYGPQLQHILKYQQSQTSFIASCGTTGLFLGGPIFGSLADSYPTYSYLFFLFGGVVIATGYLLVGFFIEQILPRPHYLILALVYLAIGLGNASCYHCSLATNYRNWPDKYRSVSVGLTVSFFGLSAFVFTHIGNAFFLQKHLVINVPDFLKFLGILCLVLNLIAMFTLRPSLNTATAEEQTPFLRETHTPSNYTFHEHEIPEYAEEEEIFYNAHSIDREQDTFYTPVSDLHIPESIGITLEEISCFRSLNAYLLGYNMFAVVGVGIMYINNVGAIGIQF